MDGRGRAQSVEPVSPLEVHTLEAELELPDEALLVSVDDAAHSVDDLEPITCSPAATYDGSRDRLLVVYGCRECDIGVQCNQVDEVMLVWNGDGWNVPLVQDPEGDGGPVSRVGGAMAFDAARGERRDDYRGDRGPCKRQGSSRSGQRDQSGVKQLPFLLSRRARVPSASMV